MPISLLAPVAAGLRRTGAGRHLAGQSGGGPRMRNRDRALGNHSRLRDLGPGKLEHRRSHRVSRQSLHLHGQPPPGRNDRTVRPGEQAVRFFRRGRLFRRFGSGPGPGCPCSIWTGTCSASVPPTMRCATAWPGAARRKSCWTRSRTACAWTMSFTRAVSPGATTGSCAPVPSTWSRRAGSGRRAGSAWSCSTSPILYLPSISFSARGARKSGFLVPEIGSSSRRGLELEAPWYWNIAPNMDATFTPRYLSRLGFFAGADYRYITRNSTGRIKLGYLPPGQAAQPLPVRPYRGNGYHDIGKMAPDSRWPLGIGRPVHRRYRPRFLGAGADPPAPRAGGHLQRRDVERPAAHYRAPGSASGRRTPLSAPHPGAGNPHARPLAGTAAQRGWADLDRDRLVRALATHFGRAGCTSSRN